ncbi:hypothetical protein KDD30_18890 (plasmid) [Photobacterium sp. GJ3]|uniref:hypothetical protein n=1 Tax=Photobacterium sp. GJ3 TaxID=2829502 RepID=UPI001B8AAF44|nr:hypothetical protein [Photobacterium sp. GJ3]QUJ70196.1 hypothetical protein KDD30_18890 [Photobacterium sp. GJ3]
MNQQQNFHWALSALVLLSFSTTAQEQGASAAQANNPLANMTALNFQNYYIGDVTESDEDANQFWIRYAKPVSVAETNWIVRASLPVNTYPIPPNGSHTTGIGDFNIFAAYLIDTGNPAVSFGVGPQLTAPTASKDEVGSEKWSAGIANVLFNASSAVFQYGYLLTWQESFAGEDARQDVNVGAFQPFAFYQLGGGTYLRAAPIWVYNFEDDSYSVPLGVGAGQVIKKGKTVYNVFVEPQFSVADDGAGYPDWQVFLGFNMQFID